MSLGFAVFFDIGDTLADAVVDHGKLAGLAVYPFVPEICARLRGVDRVGPVKLGLISNTGDETAQRLTELLTGAGLLGLVDGPLCLFSSVEGLDKTQPAFFTLASRHAQLPPARCLFVGENQAERQVAVAAGFGVSPHPLHALHFVESTLDVPPPGP